VEVEGVVYLLPGDYPAGRGSDSLNDLAVRLSELGSAAHAKLVNLVFYGGCRNNPFN
jgi:hypothetical protein